MSERSKAKIKLAFLPLTALLLCGCQSTEHSRAELAQICADPANRLPTPGNLYYDECQPFRPSYSRQLEKSYFQEAPVSGGSWHRDRT
jgi:hypothetical protein